MSSRSLSHYVIGLALCGFNVAPALAQSAPGETTTPKFAMSADGDHYSLMTPMARIAHLVAKARAEHPELSHTRSLRMAVAALNPENKPDACLVGDDDCSEEGFQDGPGATQSEMAIAVDPTGMHIVVGFNDFRGGSLNPTSISGFAYSDDGGLTFTDGKQLPITTNGKLADGTLLPQVLGDPDIKYVPGGKGCQFIYSSILIVGLPKASAPNFTGTAETMSIHRSDDCGHTWTGPFEVLPATNPTGVLSGNNARDLADKEFIDVDPETGRVLMSWSNFTSTSVIRGGVQVSTTFSDNIMTGTPPTWSPRVVLNSGSTSFDTGSVPRFAGGGSPRVYVAWSAVNTSSGLQNTMVATSTDNGVTFGPAVSLTASDFFPIDQILGNDRTNSFPSLTVDNSNSPNKGNVYVVYSMNNSGDGADIAFHRSTNGGASFSSGILINARPGADRSQWFPVVAADSATGRVNVMYDDQGVNGGGDLMQMTWMYSDDGGVTWSKPSPLTRPFHGGYGNDTSQPNLGDYNAGVAQNGAFFAAFPVTPNVVNFNDGQPNPYIGFPTFLGNAISGGTAPAPGFAKAAAAKAALDLGTVSFTDSDGNGSIDLGDTVRFKLPLRNYVLNPGSKPATYTGVSATLSTTTPGVSIGQATSSYPDIAAGAGQTNSIDYFVTLTSAFVPGTKIDFALNVNTAQGNTTLLFTQNTGTPVSKTIFSENFDSTPAGSLPAGWTAIHVGGTPTVPWTINNSFCGTKSNGLFHVNANDASGSNQTRFERVATPNITIPMDAQYVTIDFDICYDTEDDPSFNVLAYDGAHLRITDFTTGHFARANFIEGVAESITTGETPHFPKHAPRSNNSSYLQDVSMWAGDSGGFKHVSIRLNGIAGNVIQLRPDFTQDSFGTCTDVRPTHTTCGVMIDNLVVRSVTYRVSVATSALPTGTVGIPYSATLAAVGGTSPYTWAIVGGRLPAGLSLNAGTGQITGTPLNRFEGSITVQVTDSSSPAQTATGVVTLSIVPGPVTIVTTSLPSGKAGVPYSATLQTIGGTAPFKWSLNPGASLPAGLALNSATGEISGTPTAPVSNYRVAVTVTDSAKPTAQSSSMGLVLTITN